MTSAFPRWICLISLLPTMASATLVHDRQMERAIHSSYIVQTVLRDRVKASAEFGVLTLTGSVEDPSDKQLVDDLARSIAWVEDVHNKVILMPSYRETSDPWIGRMVLGRLRLRAGVEATNTRVTVKNGAVTLTGTARDEEQKALTAALAAEVAGVRSVTNDLALAALPPPPAEMIDDPSVTAMVLANLRPNENARRAITKVAAEAGEIHITGLAESEAQKALITRLAQQARGVRHVTNLMKVSR